MFGVPTFLMIIYLQLSLIDSKELQNDTHNDGNLKSVKRYYRYQETIRYRTFRETVNYILMPDSTRRYYFNPDGLGKIPHMKSMCDGILKDVYYYNLPPGSPDDINLAETRYQSQMTVYWTLVFTDCHHFQENFNCSSELGEMCDEKNLSCTWGRYAATVMIFIVTVLITIALTYIKLKSKWEYC